MLVLLKLHSCFVHGLKMCMWFGYNPQIRFGHFLRNLNLFFFQALILSTYGPLWYIVSTYVDSMYLVRVTPPINFTSSDYSVFL